MKYQKYQKRMNIFITRIFEGFLVSELSEMNKKIRLEMIRLDCSKLDQMDYCEYYLRLFCSREDFYQMDKNEIFTKTWEKFDLSLTILENLILKIGFVQKNHKSEIEYLHKEIGLKDSILSRLKSDIQKIKGEYKIDNLWDQRVEMENVVESENGRLRALLEISLQVIKDEQMVSNIYENNSKTRLLGLDMNKFLKVIEI